jgi:nitrite reductase/ring-hydroxylating ferredoxin subunit/uncharacterized membrane protein
MRSRAQFKAHPIHPALIPFPFAFLIGATMFDVLGMAAGDPEWSLTGGHLIVAGLISGLLAAIPGAVDFIYTVPPASSGKKRAARHAIGNVTALSLFAAAFALRSPDWQPTALTIVLEIVGAGVLAYAGWLGGTLVTRNLISVDHRYAQTGKWQETQLTRRGADPLVVGHVDDLKEDQMKLLHVNGKRVVLARTADGYRAFDDQCTHRGGSLAGGVLICGTVQCLWHGSQFDVSTGAVSCGPAKKRIAVYGIEEKPNGQIVLVSPPE